MDSLNTDNAGEDGGNDFIDLSDLVGSTGGDLDLGSLSLDSAEPEPSPEGAGEMGAFLDSIPVITIEAAITGKRDHLYHAAMLDPIRQRNFPLMT
jgi:hypothetical protein